MMPESSSSDDETSARLKEAVWCFGPQDVKINGKGGENNARQSRRVDVSKHEHDGNELGTTPEFQSHVAKKLGAILDGCISEVFSEPVDSEPGQSKNRDEENEEGFRLFSTSASGKWMEQSPPPPKRRPIPSSSDSDSEMEMRLREAAVSVADILGPLAQTLKEKTEEKSTTNVESEKEDTVTKKKKKKRKTFTKGSEEKSINVSEKQSNGEGAEAQTTVVENLTKKKKKKKKRKKLELGRNCNDE
ncbi:protein CUSTOS [Pseudorasbora parva]|uniref:protein CUSTOS n=1 Tax=Pseudorasbora parva TaxID=51549 RepID=UPI00351DD034